MIGRSQANRTLKQLASRSGLGGAPHVYEVQSLTHRTADDLLQVQCWLVATESPNSALFDLAVFLNV